MAKGLSLRQAKNCEEALEPVCKCRCGGYFHGQQRGGANAGKEFYYALPEDDPHYTPSPEVRAQRQKDKLEAKRKERDAMRAEADKVANDLRTALTLAQRDGDYDLAEQLQQQFLEAHRRREEIYKQTKI